MTRLVEQDGTARGKPLYQDKVGGYYFHSFFQDHTRGVSFPILVPCDYNGREERNRPIVSDFAIITKEIEQAHGWHGPQDAGAACVLCDVAGWMPV